MTAVQFKRVDNLELLYFHKKTCPPGAINRALNSVLKKAQKVFLYKNIVVYVLTVSCVSNVTTNFNAIYSSSELNSSL